MPYVLDSCAFFELLKNSDHGVLISNFLGDEQIKINTISLYETLLGAKQNELNTIYNFLSGISVLNFDQKAAEAAAEIEKQLKASGKMINQMDILIAGICKANDMAVITLDKDFEKIKGLDVKVIR